MTWGSLGRPWDLIFDYHVYIGEGGEHLFMRALDLFMRALDLWGGLEGLGGPLRSPREALGLEF